MISWVEAFVTLGAETTDGRLLVMFEEEGGEHRVLDVDFSQPHRGGIVALGVCGGDIAEILDGGEVWENGLTGYQAEHIGDIIERMCRAMARAPEDMRLSMFEAGDLAKERFVSRNQLAGWSDVEETMTWNDVVSTDRFLKIDPARPFAAQATEAMKRAVRQGRLTAERMDALAKAGFGDQIERAKAELAEELEHLRMFQQMAVAS